MRALGSWVARLRDTVWRCLPAPRAFDVSALLPPPWVAKPEWPGDSLGWRMGGEQYFHAVRAMYRDLTPSQQAAYDRAYPEPPGWDGYLVRERRGLRPRRR